MGWVGKKELVVMGMISFDRKAGIELRASDAAVAARDGHQTVEALLAAHLTSLGLPAHMLSFEFVPSSATVRLSGRVHQQDDRERIVLCIGNVCGMAGVEDAIEVIMPSDVSQWRFVQPGDTFRSIAFDAYRDSELGEDLRSANQPLVGSVDAPVPGWLLRIPPRDCLPGRRQVKRD